jgi:hypothetical protein
MTLLSIAVELPYRVRVGAENIHDTSPTCAVVATSLAYTWSTLLNGMTTVNPPVAVDGRVVVNVYVLRCASFP